MKDRILWVDWIRAIGMFFIIWGHTFPYNYTSLIYSFSVPLFFVMSGYLSKTITDRKKYAKKLWRSLIVPYFLICIVNMVIGILVFHKYYLSIESIAKSLLAIITGLQNSDDTIIGIGSMWFVYALLIIKIIHMYTSKGFLILISILSLILVPFIKIIFDTLDYYYTVFSVLLSIPFYTMGVCCSTNKIIENMHLRVLKMSPLTCGLYTLFAVCVLCYLTELNSAPFLYKLVFGNYELLMVFNAVLAISIILMLVFRLDAHLLSRIGGGGNLTVINIGLIVILGFQRHFILLITYLLKPILRSHYLYDMLSLLLSIFILLLFIPIIKFLQVHFPAIIGFRTKDI